MENVGTGKRGKKILEKTKSSTLGFTLVELLAVIVILAIVLIIAVPGVLSIINKTKNSAYDRQIDMIKEAAKNYVTANSITWNGDNPKSTLVTLDMLQSGGYLDKKILDPRDKKEILCANVLVSKDNKNKITYDVDMTCNEIQPITPRVGSGMIPIVYKDGNWVKADRSNKNFAWFNYGNQQWANVATVTEDVRQTLLDAPDGTVVPMDKINTMFTWIPRFKYKLFNVDGTVSPVGNKNLAGDYMIDIQFETASTTKSTGTQNGQWLTHPAFTFGGQELEGFWVGKFETGYLGAATTSEAEVNIVDPMKVIVKPDVYSWRGITLSNMVKLVTQLKQTSSMGITGNEDSHLIKNNEWGALVYLTQSKYGKTGNLSYSALEKQVRINNVSSYVTGCGADIQDVFYPASQCDRYETVNGMSASTTGNITGVYDTSGGAWDYVAGAKLLAGTSNYNVSASGFTQEELNTLVQEGKYFEPFPEEGLVAGAKLLGSATLELGPIVDATLSWYEDFATYPTDGNPFLLRGGSWGNIKASGINAMGVGNGNQWNGHGFRISMI